MEYQQPSPPHILTLQISVLRIPKVALGPRDTAYEHLDYLIQPCPALTYLRQVDMDHAPFAQYTDRCKFN
jgi:hypothetical protein